MLTASTEAHDWCCNTKSSSQLLPGVFQPKAFLWDSEVGLPVCLVHWFTLREGMPTAVTGRTQCSWGRGTAGGMHFEGRVTSCMRKVWEKRRWKAEGGAELWDQGGGPWEMENAHTNRFSNRHIPQVIDLELLYQLILRRWEFHCRKEEEAQSWWQILLTPSPHHAGMSWTFQPRPYLHPFPLPPFNQSPSTHLIQTI